MNPLGHPAYLTLASQEPLRYALRSASAGKQWRNHHPLQHSRKHCRLPTPLGLPPQQSPTPMLRILVQKQEQTLTKSGAPRSTYEQRIAEGLSTQRKSKQSSPKDHLSQ